MIAGIGPEMLCNAQAVGSYSVISQAYRMRRPRNPTSSSVIEPTRIGPGDSISCRREAGTHVGSFSGVETYSKT